MAGSKDGKMNIYCGNLSYQLTEEELRGAFEQYGQVDSVRIITDAQTRRSKGFGFVEMADDAQAKAAIEAINNTELAGRPVRVNEARPRPERRPGGGGGRDGGGWRGSRDGGRDGGFRR